MTPANDNYPIVLTRPQAAAMCGLTTSGFDTWVRKGVVPPALHGTRRWSRVAIERALSGDALVSADANLSPYELWKAQNAG